MGASPVELEQQLRALAASWEGTPHLDGGTGRNGIDAAAFVQLAASEIMNVDLPRTTARQLGVGEEILRDALLPGDLIFFRPISQPRHVALYLGGDEFVHAWPDDGVIISQLNDSYWSGAFWVARRLMAQPTLSTPSQPSRPQPARGRRGW